MSRVVERNRPYDTFGWGVVFSDQTLRQPARGRPRDRARRSSTRSTTGTTSTSTSAGARSRSGGHGFCGIGRKRLLNILQARCEELGVKLVFEARRRKATSTFPDGRPRHRQRRAQQPHPQQIRRDVPARHRPARSCRFVWLGTNKRFDAFTFAFEETEHGLVPGARLPVRRRDVDVHRRDAGGGLAATPGSTRWRRRTASRSASGCSRGISTATS